MATHAHDVEVPSYDVPSVVLSPVIPFEDSVLCVFCGDAVSSSQTVLRPDVGRICWFCHADEEVDDLDDERGDDDYDDDYDDYDDWS